MRRPAAGLAAAGLAAALIVSGCGVLQPGVPDWVANRLPLQACAAGVVRADSAEGREGQRCLLEAYRAGRGAELVTAAEIETGDPLTSYVRVHDNGTVEMFLNLGDDPFAPGAWERFRCEKLADGNSSEEADAGIFSLEGCEQLPVP